MSQISSSTVEVPLEQITVKRDERQRRKVVSESLKQSISAVGLLHPIIIDKDFVLVAGECRLQAHRELGRTTILCRFTEDLSQHEKQIIELEENAKRTDLSWTDSTLAYARIYRMFTESEPGISYEAVGERLGITGGHLSKVLLVHSYLDEPAVAEAATWNAAYGIAAKRAERRAQDMMESIGDLTRGALNVTLARDVGAEKIAATRPDGGAAPVIGRIAPTPMGGAENGPQSPVPAYDTPADPTATDDTILQANFVEWASTYEGPKFNFLHCDFPYGVGLFTGGYLGGHDGYNDSVDTYETLIKALCANLDRLMTANAHMMFWFSMEHYIKTIGLFQKLAPSLIFQRFPLVWHKTDNAGIAPDSSRQPRRVYETAFLATRGERFIVKAISNTYGAPTDRQYHPSAKPVPVLKHFFQLFVDDGTRMLDPTCGGGSSIRAAEDMGAQHVLGLELDPQHRANACTALRKARLLRNAEKASKGKIQLVKGQDDGEA